MNELLETGTIANDGLHRQAKTHGRLEGLDAAGSLRAHWPEYLMEAGELTLYMFFTCVFATLLQHPASPVRQFIVSAIFRRALLGLAVGATVAAIVMTPLPWRSKNTGPGI